MKQKSMKFHPKHMTWLMPLVLSGLMSGAISCFNLFKNMGYSENFWLVWLESWTLSWLIAYPLILIFLPLVRRFLIKFVIASHDE